MYWFDCRFYKYCDFASLLPVGQKEDNYKMAGSGYYYELPVPREYVGNYGGLNGNVYGPPPQMPYANNAAMQGLCKPVSSALSSQI